MLGEVSEAEDVVQDAYLRWRGTDWDKVENPKAFLSRIVTRLCLDRLKEARRRRETYTGAWLPEPLVETLVTSIDPEAELAEDISFALMLALERLSPLERAAFLLRDVFDLSFAEVALTLDKSEVACRQLASRARARVKKGVPLYTVTPDESARLTEEFFVASRSGDTGKLKTLLADSVRFYSDGGGRKIAALRPIFGLEKVCRLFAGLARKPNNIEPLWRKELMVNGLPGYVSVERDGTLQITALEMSDGRIHGIYVIRNPDKVAHLLPLVPEHLRASVG